MTHDTTKDMTKDAIDVRDDPDGSRFTAVVDGTVAGFVSYRYDGDAIALLHTEVDPAYEGQGVGSRLVEGVLTQLRDRGTAVLPHCSFVQEYLQRHEEFVSLVPESERSRFDLS
jgi:uncharacterized protein